ncbi:MAG: hypothetical protein Q9Q13_11935, partial [Acidobacteriota bacterium]|nr:hypothetical protein [Acidobacteriota bacterium]
MARLAVLGGERGDQRPWRRRLEEAGHQLESAASVELLARRWRARLPHTKIATFSCKVVVWREREAVEKRFTINAKTVKHPNLP